MKKIILSALFILPLLFCCTVFADSSWTNAAPSQMQALQADSSISTDKSNAVVPDSSDNTSSDTFTAITSFEFIMVIAFLVFAMFVIYIYFLLFKSGKLTNYQIVKLLILTLIIVFTSIFITVGFMSTQTAPVIGLFGTIAGYLLGKSSSNET